MEDIVRAFNITYKDEATQVVNLKAGSWLFHATVKSGTPVYSIGLKDANGVWHNIDLSDQIVQGEWHDVEQVIETDYDIVEISLLNNVGTAQVLLPMLETGTKKSTKRPHVLDIEESAIVQSASWEIHTSTPVIYKDAPDTQTEGEHTPITVTGRHWVGSVMTEEGFLTATADGDEEGIPVASPLILNAVNGKSSYTLRLYSDVEKTELLDYETIPIVFKGARGLNAIQVHLDNPIDSIPADKDGNALTMQGTGTLIRVFEGAEKLFYDGAGETPSTYKVTAVATDIVMGSIGYANNTCTVQDAISMPAEKSKATIVYTVSGYTLDGYYFSLNVEQNFTKTNKGADGDGILAVIDYYGVSTSASVLPATWYDYVPAKSANQFLWNYERIYYSDLTYDETQARVIQGKDARSIHDIKNAYAYSASDTVSPTSGWQYSLASLGTKPAGYFLWVREDIAYTDNPTNYISTVGYVVRDGADGVSITDVDVEFAKNTNPTTAPTTGWTTTAPTLTGTEQLWTRTKTAYSSGNPTYSTPANITPRKGDTGTSISAVVEEYYLSTSNTSQTDDSWSETPPTWVQGKYIWSRVKITYTNPSSTETTTPYLSPEWDAINNTKLTAEQAQLSADGYMRARYVRDWISGNSVNLDNQWNEIRIFNKIGVNIAQGKSVESNGTINTPANVTDNVTTTGSSIINSTKTDNWVKIDLGSIIYDIDSIQIWHHYSDNRTYYGTKTEISEDGINWTTIFDSTIEGTYKETEEGKIHSQRWAKVMAKLNQSKAIADKFKTTINGGLITTVMMLLREANSLINTAGISGIQTDQTTGLKNMPSYWSGGSYEQAITFVPFIKALQEGTAIDLDDYNNLPKIVFLHSGAGKLGDFIVEESGRVVMIDPATGAVRLTFNTENIGAIKDVDQSDGGSTNIGSGVAYYQKLILPGSVTVTKNGSTGFHAGGEISITASGRKQASGAPSEGEVVLYMYRDGAKYASLGYSHLYFGGDTNETKTGYGTISPRTFSGLPTGIYTFGLENTFVGDISNPSSSSSASSFSWNYTVAGARHFGFGLDGLLAYFANNHLYFTENGGLDVRGKTNLPGVLLSATVLIAGGWMAVWGAKASLVSPVTPAPVRNSTGRYTVSHDVGHTNYQIYASSHTANTTFHIVSKSADGFTIEWRTVASSPVLVNTTFDFQLVGNNYA